MADSAVPPSGKPVLLVADHDRRGGVVVSELQNRYGSDYEVLTAGPADDPVAVLTELRDNGRLVAITLAGQLSSGMTGPELLATARDIHRTARCLLLMDTTYGPPPEPILRAIALRQIDTYVARPVVLPDERFHLAVTELLAEWARSHLPKFEDVRVVGEEWSARSHEIRDLLGRNVVPSGFYPADSERGINLLQQAGATGPLPVIVLADGRSLANPSNAEIAEALGLKTRASPGRYDLAVIGAGPAGLAAAVYGASEGLSTVVIEEQAIGGQAGTSSRIRNYLGFPTGISGEDLALRAYTQAWNFGAEYVYGNPAADLRALETEHVVTATDGSEVHSRAVVIATGAAYRRLGIQALDVLIGAGVFYGAATSEAAVMKGRNVFVVGGANSAGQAAIHLARYAATVTMLVRGPSLAEGMSDYLVKEIASAANIEVRHNSVITGGTGTDRLESLTIKNLASGLTEAIPAAAVFILIGAEPRTQWLPDSSTASISRCSGNAGGAVMRAFSVARFTDAATPGRSASFRCTRAAQAAQVMPRIASSTSVRSGSGAGPAMLVTFLSACFRDGQSGYPFISLPPGGCAA